VLQIVDKGQFRPLDMYKTLQENDVPDEAPKFTKLSIPVDYYWPVIHLYFNDDLTVA
jgi:hypothetical protein